jgi:HD-GYP domain-containing protein (c-di-GMP phosphodiesterase class II)
MLTRNAPAITQLQSGEFNLEDVEIEQLSLAAYLHEIGRLGIPDYILPKTDSLTEEEQRIVESNFESAAKLLSGIPEINQAALTVRYQHERFDGSGFPERLEGEEIPLHARILCVANAYDSLTNPHYPQKPLTPGEAIEQMRNEDGKKFDPVVVEAFCKIDLLGQIRPAIGGVIVDVVSPNAQTPSKTGLGSNFIV